MSIPLLTAWLATHFSWQIALVIPGLIGIVMGLWLCMQLKGTPAEEGLPTVGVWRRDILNYVKSKYRLRPLC